MTRTSTRTSIITGVSRGLGAEFFTQLYERGDRVVGIGRSFSTAQQNLARDVGDRVVLREADLSRPDTLPDPAEMRHLVADATDTVLIHNAGVVGPIDAVGELSADRISEAVTVNLTAPMLLTNALLAAVPQRTGVTILFVSSGAAHRVVGGWAVYGATKRGGEAFFDSVAAQLADRPRTRVANVNPGVMDTGMQAAIREAAAGPAWFPDRDRYLSLHREGRLPDPAQVARDLLDAHLPAST